MFLIGILLGSTKFWFLEMYSECSFGVKKNTTYVLWCSLSNKKDMSIEKLNKKVS